MICHQFKSVSAYLLALTCLGVGCAAESTSPNSAIEQAVVNPPLPGDLNLILNAKTSVTIGPFVQISGDIGSSGVTGSVLLDVNSSQSFSDNLLANTVTVRVGASAGRILGNDLTVDGFSQSRALGLDPTTMPAVPGVTTAVPGTTNISVNANQSKQLCPGQYGAISLGRNATLNLNGGVYQFSRLTLADGARLLPSEPVVLLIAGAMTTGIDAQIVPYSPLVNPMTASQIRIEISGNATIGDRTRIRAHLLAPNGRLALGQSTTLTGAAWAKTIAIGSQSDVFGEDVFSTVAAQVPPPCNDNSACTVDTCVGGGTSVATCRNTPVPSGTSCEDGNSCNGAEVCSVAGQCQPGTNASSGTSCADDNQCNGDETCNGAGTCVPGAPPVVNDRNTCTADSCDPASGVSNVDLPDGTTCNGAGACTAGTCSVEGPISGSFSYSAVDTNSATQNTVNFDIPIVEGQTLAIGTCNLPDASGFGDTYLRLFDASDNLVAGNDDSCDLLTFFTFTATTTGTFQVRAGCFGSSSCSGTVAFTLSDP
jgi:hypothetical protein